MHVPSVIQGMILISWKVARICIWFSFSVSLMAFFCLQRESVGRLTQGPETLTARPPAAAVVTARNSPFPSISTSPVSNYQTTYVHADFKKIQSFPACIIFFFILYDTMNRTWISYNYQLRRLGTLTGHRI